MITTTTTHHVITLPSGMELTVSNLSPQDIAFFESIEAMAPANSGITADWLEERAHRRCRRYIHIDTDAPYQFDSHTLMDLAWDIAKKIGAKA